MIRCSRRLPALVMLALALLPVSLAAQARLTGADLSGTVADATGGVLPGAAVTVAALVVGSFVTAESADNTRANRAVSLFGIAVFLLFLWATSKHRRQVNWRPVIGGMLAQYIIALFVLRTRVGYDIFKVRAEAVGVILSPAAQRH